MSSSSCTALPAVFAFHAQLDVMDVDGATIDGSLRWGWGAEPTRNRQIDPGPGFFRFLTAEPMPSYPISSGREFTQKRYQGMARNTDRD